LRENGCKIRVKNDKIELASSGTLKSALLVETMPFPGFPTDLQAQMTTLATVSEGTSVITENIFEMRFKFARELIKMGADIKFFGNTAVVQGVKKLHGAQVKAEDLRGGASLVLAGLCAEGKTIVSDIGHVERGYLSFDKKLSSLGVDIKKKN
jgi:UDP-N-acetylglucosamine 1-carboxyvinyltransferase